MVHKIKQKKIRKGKLKTIGNVQLPGCQDKKITAALRFMRRAADFIVILLQTIA